MFELNKILGIPTLTYDEVSKQNSTSTQNTLDGYLSMLEIEIYTLYNLRRLSVHLLMYAIKSHESIYI